MLTLCWLTWLTAIFGTPTTEFMPRTFARDSGTLHQVRKIWHRAGGVLYDIRSVWHRSGGVLHKVFARGFTITISSDETDFSSSDVTNALVAAGWNGVDPIDATLVLASGIYCRSTSTASAALTVPALPGGSTFTISNLGFFQGKGGNGGTGGNGGAGTNGAAGGPAISLGMPVTIENGSGFILGGGGGGAGGSFAADACGGGKSAESCDQGGGGGGGGAGTGAGGTGFGTPANHGNAGTNINTSGANGSGGVSRTLTCCGADTSSEAGGNGGDWGAAGSNTAARTGGAAGKAIQTNGHAVIFSSGGSSPNVKGAVS